MNSHSDLGKGPESSPHRPQFETEEDYELPINGFPGTPEEKDRIWFTKYYRGDRQKQLTVRAVIMGGVLGMFMAISNLYTSLKIGWSFGVTITACVLSFVIWNSIRALLGGRPSRMTILENNCMQSTASAAGVATGSTLGTAFGALLLITGAHQPWYFLAPYVLLVAALGTFVAIPMKRQMINHEQLRFPSGTASAETLRSLYAKGAQALRQAYSLLFALLFGAIVGVLRSYGELANQFRVGGRPQVWLENLHRWLHIPESIHFPKWMTPISGGSLYGLAFEPSVLLIGAGMITGLRVSLSMLAGSVLLYFVVTPQLVALDAANAGVEGYVRTFTPVGDNLIIPTRWALWGGTATMVFASMMQVALNWRTVLRAFNVFKKRERSADSDALDSIEVPTSWFVIGLIPITIGLVVLQFLAFNISIFLGLIAVAISFLVSLVCCRATGETDTVPIGAMGKVVQLLYAVLPGAKGIASTNLIAAGTAAGAGGAAADLLTDLKSGYLLGANPRRQFLAQFIGVFFGTIVIVPAWYLMVPNKEVLEAMNPPATNMWKATADLLTQGVHMLPKTALWAIVIGSLVGIALPIIERLLPRSRPYLPSAMGLGLAWVIPFQNSLSFAIGATLVLIWQKFRRKQSEHYAVPVASGLVAGESLVAALIAIGCTVVGLALAN